MNRFTGVQFDISQGLYVPSNESLRCKINRWETVGCSQGTASAFPGTLDTATMLYCNVFGSRFFVKES